MGIVYLYADIWNGRPTCRYKLLLTNTFSERRNEFWLSEGGGQAGEWATNETGLAGHR